MDTFQINDSKVHDFHQFEHPGSQKSVSISEKNTSGQVGRAGRSRTSGRPNGYGSCVVAQFNTEGACLNLEGLVFCFVAMLARA